jgi:hypothetical protein
MSIQNHRLFLATVATLPLLFSAGCNHALWETKKERRVNRIHTLSCRYAKHDAEGKDRIHRTLGRASTHCEYHKEHLAKTSALVEREIESDERRWREEAPKRRAFVHWQWQAHPETIPSTWAKMVY